jgi:beta-phosphoglucomutase
MLQAVIFDLDGVIVDTHPAHKLAWKSLCASLRKELDDRDLEFVVEGHKRADILRHFLGELTAEQVADYGARKEALFRRYAGQVRIVEGALSFLDQVTSAGLSIALASCASRARVEYMLRQFAMQSRFGSVVSGDDVPQGKPDPAIFLLAARQLGIAPENILVCEDAVNGVEAAKLAGMKCLAIAGNGRGPLLQHAGADRVVPDFSNVRLADLQCLFHAPNGRHVASYAAASAPTMEAKIR